MCAYLSHDFMVLGGKYRSCFSPAFKLRIETSGTYETIPVVAVHEIAEFWKTPCKGGFSLCRVYSDNKENLQLYVVQEGENELFDYVIE
ncbi:hypothetical protein NDU88_004172 [Pleurodeles waltl]|uniref:Uncharacterized protein n=1 Tax=Pleurodeles waltl TaxID=8319 RepID=A0AAV7MWG5_PLEWA|nr:hypothetical protein NDU88_004172 [Pleurodeles waltl]